MASRLDPSVKAGRCSPSCFRGLCGACARSCTRQGSAYTSGPASGAPLLCSLVRASPGGDVALRLRAVRFRVRALPIPAGATGRRGRGFSWFNLSLRLLRPRMKLSWKRGACYDSRVLACRITTLVRKSLSSFHTVKLCMWRGSRRLTRSMTRSRLSICRDDAALFQGSRRLHRQGCSVRAHVALRRGVRSSGARL